MVSSVNSRRGSIFWFLVCGVVVVWSEFIICLRCLVGFVGKVIFRLGKFVSEGVVSGRIRGGLGLVVR